MGTYDCEEFHNYDDTYKEYKYDLLKHETEKAYLFTIGFNDYWVPKSICIELNKTLKQFNINQRFTLSIAS